MKINGLVMRIFPIMILCIVTIHMHAQSDNRIVMSFTSLQSLQQQEGRKLIGTYKGLKEPKGGFSCSLQLEKDINKSLYISTGLFYEIRKNAFVYKYDTTDLFYVADGLYKYTNSSTFKFVGIPVEIGLHYLNHPKFSIYQTFGIRLSYLIYAKSIGENFFQESQENVNDDFLDNRNSIIFSLSGSIVVRQRIYKKISVEISPGVNYMVNQCTDDYRFLDIKLNGGVVFDL